MIQNCAKIFTNLQPSEQIELGHFHKWSHIESSHLQTKQTTLERDRANSTKH